MTRSRVFVMGFLLILGWYNFQIWSKEQMRANGEMLILELAPVDPRSLMQGDYMVLTYSLAGKIPGEAREGVVHLQPDSEGLASEVVSKGPNTIKLRYRRTGKYSTRAEFGIEDYFFQEGQRQRFEAARFAELRVDPDGNASLIRLLDESRRPIEP